MKLTRLTQMLLVAVGILCVPLVAMQFTSEVNWTLSDFLIMGALLAITVFTIEGALCLLKTRTQRLIACGVIIFGFLLIWVELAVGLFGTPFAGS